jgi:type IV pilus assembly protein PilE
MTFRFHSKSNQGAGFTLIELMVSLTIAAILLSIAVPAYQTQMRKSRRTEARNAVLDLAAREERYLSIYNLYSQTPSELGYGTSTTWAAVGAIGSGYYTLSVSKNDPDTTVDPPTLPTYTITATATGSQVKDTACKTFTINQLGQQTATDSSDAATTNCWN